VESLSEPLTRDVGQGVTAEAFAVFYDRLRAIKEYHMRFPYLSVAKPIVEPQDLPHVAFSGVEVVCKKERKNCLFLNGLRKKKKHHGRHLDLHEFFDSFMNLSHIKARRDRDPSFSLSYREYVGSFFEFDSSQVGKDAEYLHYLQDLLGYLIDFLKRFVFLLAFAGFSCFVLNRAQPLLDTAHLIRKIESESLAQWEDGSFRSWGGGAEEQNELYCLACATSFAKQGTYDGHLKGKKHQVRVDVGWMVCFE
jgi:splicing factor 3A subunit 3